MFAHSDSSSYVLAAEECTAVQRTACAGAPIAVAVQSWWACSVAVEVPVACTSAKRLDSAVAAQDSQRQPFVAVNETSYSCVGTAFDLACKGSDTAATFVQSALVEEYILACH